MKLIFAEKAWKDYRYWEKTDKEMLDRINMLIHAINKSPFGGVGKPEPLNCALSGYWSRRINDEHRIVYKAQQGSLLIAQLRYRY